MQLVLEQCLIPNADINKVVVDEVEGLSVRRMERIGKPEFPRHVRADVQVDVLGDGRAHFVGHVPGLVV